MLNIFIKRHFILEIIIYIEQSKKGQQSSVLYDKGTVKKHSM